MPRLFYLTLGFHENFAIRRLSVNGASTEDFVLAVTLSPAVSGVVKAFDSLRLYASRLGISSVELFEVPGEDVAMAIGLLVDRLTSLVARGYDPVVADLTGGSRFLTAASLISLTLISDLARVDVYLQSDTGAAWESRIPPGIMGLLREGLSREKERIVEAIRGKPGITPDEIAEATGTAPKTVRNHLSAMKSMGIVYSRGRGGGYYLTKWGELVASVAKSRERLAGTPKRGHFTRPKTSPESL